jgi:2-polyprenyl-3-methyl-5-hydroxy-6-metoxy-1,4-benzoquinol methylase
MAWIRQVGSQAEEFGESAYKEHVSLTDTANSDIERNLHIARYVFASSLDLGGRVLDCACGTGYGTEILGREGDRVVIGADISREVIERARELCTSPRVCYIQADISQPGQFPSPFTGVVSFETIEHMPNPDAALRHFGEVLEPGGVLVISTPNGGITSPLRRLQPANRFHCWEEDVSSFIRRLQRAGFQVRASLGQAYLPPRVCALYRLARARGQLLAGSRLARLESLFLCLEAALIRRFQSKVISDDSEAMPSARHTIECCMYQVHICQWSGG